jgi:hypothetical protein
LPFLPLFDIVARVFALQMPNSSLATQIGNLTCRVMGGKSGKKRQRGGNEVATDGTVGGKNGKVCTGAREYPGRHTGGCR